MFRVYEARHPHINVWVSRYTPETYFLAKANSNLAFHMLKKPCLHFAFKSTSIKMSFIQIMNINKMYGLMHVA